MTDWEEVHGRAEDEAHPDIVEPMDTTLERERRLNRLLQRSAVAANVTSSVDEALRAIVGIICEATGWDVGHAYVVADDGSLVPSTSWHLTSDEDFGALQRATMSMILPPGAAGPSEAARRREPVWIPDVRTVPNHVRGSIGDLGVRCHIACPVEVDGRVVAVLEFFSRQALERDAELIEVLDNVATQVGRVYERQAARSALAEQAEALRHVNVELEQATRAKSAFLATMPSAWDGRAFMNVLRNDIRPAEFVRCSSSRSSGCTREAGR